MAEKRSSKLMPRGIWMLGAALLAGYIIAVVALIWNGWDAKLGGEAGATPNEWSRYKEAVEVLGGAATVVVAALGGFLAQEPAKRRIAKDLRILGLELVRYRGQVQANLRNDVAEQLLKVYPSIDPNAPQFVRDQRTADPQFPEDVQDILAEYGVTPLS